MTRPAAISGSTSDAGACGACTSAGKRFEVVENATVVIWNTLSFVEQHFRKLNVPRLCMPVYDGTIHRDGTLAITRVRELRAVGRRLHSF